MGFDWVKVREWHVVFLGGEGFRSDGRVRESTMGSMKVPLRWVAGG